ncbi:flagellar protein FliS [Sporosarcina sp. Sa2YVA2]|uniref:Flagellar protein FliS n=1 Tax=Sporosarcina quadrami TaxID=2762234 RepID=A0ABR8UAZ4_9BACL|nr:flagellar export chaperone FliS [Sporosarcina quadrami]MBD7985194.1 flagellar protein FliS [Sporosarcina quadrami]
MTTVDIEKAIQIYKEASTSTLSMMEYIILLLNELHKNIEQCEKAFAQEDIIERDRTIRKAQDILFEIMTTTDQETDHSVRLMTLYIHMNQCLVKTQLTKQPDLLPHIADITVQLIASWQVSKQVTRRRTFTTNQL